VVALRYTLIIYDISDDNLRLKVSETCKDFGLARIQKSAFLGPQTSSRRRELIARLRRILVNGGPRDNVQVFELEPVEVRSRMVIGSFSLVEEEGLVIYV